jgi:hypothetical protein
VEPAAQRRAVRFGFRPDDHQCDDGEERGSSRRVGRARGDAALPPGLSLSVFRLVQESLTNARPHGGSGPTQIVLPWKTDAVRLHVISPLAAARHLDVAVVVLTTFDLDGYVFEAVCAGAASLC